ncbi:hypothetical protein JCM33374_g3464 [Metschnikowia sp. JCM 33374]|nr:hypothetical protein JCM33374_g3464 [Metschnikowia sp. JCM 33374]
MSIPKDLTESNDESTKIRRQRAVIVCTNCRRRKIKCDKGKPCSNCVLRKCSQPCEYDQPPVTKAEDKYTMQLHFDYSGHKADSFKTPAEPGRGYVGQFSLHSNPMDVEKPSRKKPKKNTQGYTPHSLNQKLPSFDANISENQDKINETSPDSTLVSAGTSVAGDQKSELQFLKERLERLERSLSSNSKELVSTPSSISTFVGSGSTKSSSTNGFNEFPSALKLGNYPLGSQNQPSSFGNTHPLGYTADRQLGSLLPPLSNPLKYEADRFPPMNPNGYDINSHIDPSTCNSMNSNFPMESKTHKPNPSILTYPTKFDPRVKEYLLIGKNITGNSMDTINFYEHYSSLHQKDDIRRINFGPFSWSSLMKRDQGLHLVWEHIKLRKENSVALVFANSTGEITQENTNTILNSEKGSDESEKQFEKRALEVDGIDEILPYSSILKARKERSVPKQKLNSKTLLMGLSHYDVQIDRQLDTIEKIRSVLPNKRIIWKLVHRFFDAVYVYVPYLDEGYFKEDLFRIIGTESYQEIPVSELKIERKLDLAIVGILLIMLRLAYLSILSNNTSLTERILNSADPSPEIQNMKYLLTNPISIDTINVATLCLDQFQFLRRANFTVLQLALYLRIYHIFAPEDGDGADGGGSQVLSGVLLQMSYQLGLNREPDETCTNLRMNNLSRKIWHFMLVSDLHLASSFGNPLSTDEKFCDTKFPFSVPGGENLIEKSKDRTIIDRYLGCGAMFFGMKDILKETLDINNRISLSRLTSILSTWEAGWYRHSGTLKDCLSSGNVGENSLIDRNFSIKTYIASRCFLTTILFHVYLYYESKNIDLSFFYFKKCLLISAADVMPHYSTLLKNSEVLSDMIINPTLQMFIHKSNMVFLSGIIRVNFTIFHLRESMDHVRRCGSDPSYASFYQKLCQLSSCLTRAAEYTISAINKISHCYYYAWRITKSQTVLLRNVTSTEFYKDNYSKAHGLCALGYSSSQLDELIYICESTLTSFQNSEFPTFGFSERMDTELSQTSNSSTLSGSFTPNEGITDLETDKLWLQILSWKHDISSDYQFDGQIPVTGKGLGDGESLKYTMATETENLVTPASTNHMDPSTTTNLDIFSDIPFNDGFFN